MVFLIEIFVKLCFVLGKGIIIFLENKDVDVLFLFVVVNVVKLIIKIYSFRFICISMCFFIFFVIIKNSYFY